MLLEENIHPKIVSERLGHSTISITLDTYTHVSPERKRNALLSVNKKISELNVEKEAH